MWLLRKRRRSWRGPEWCPFDPVLGRELSFIAGRFECDTARDRDPMGLKMNWGGVAVPPGVTEPEE